MTEVTRLGLAAKAAAKVLAITDTESKNRALEEIARNILACRDEILAANARDAALAKENGINDVMIDRLLLTEQRLENIANAVRKVISLPDPVGEETLRRALPNGLDMRRVRVPLGVAGIIYESRPNVTVDAAVLCLKAGNAAFLRGGKETIHSNIVLERVMQDAVERAGLPRHSVVLLHDTDRAAAREMMRARGLIDVLIPRGGAGLIRAIIAEASVPVIETGTGNCHIYVDQSADLDMGVRIIVNAKTQRVSVCNTAESLLVHREEAERFLPMAKAALEEKGVELRLCPRSLEILGGGVPATEEDYGAEYLDYILSVKVVDSLDEAIAHIERYSTHHSDSIVTENAEAAERFLNHVDSAAVYWNASTRFTDGEEMGFGAEIGISTQKMHARGPMGLEELCSYKYVVRGTGQIRK